MYIGIAKKEMPGRIMGIAFENSDGSIVVVENTRKGLYGKKEKSRRKICETDNHRS